jgi:hypothetical protein
MPTAEIGTHVTNRPPRSKGGAPRPTPQRPREKQVFDMVGGEDGAREPIMTMATAPNAPRPAELPADTLTVKQSVLADVSCVLARSGGADIDTRQAISAARNICEILFAHPQHSGRDIPCLFWETPLGRAVGACYEDVGQTDATSTPPPALPLPADLLEHLAAEAEAHGKSISEWALEKLAR